jgi:hypothetical protein
LVDAIRDRVIASDTESAIGQDQVWPAVRKLSNWVRESLGEAMEHIKLSNQLEKVTTRSLRALQLFTAADDASRHQEWAISAQLTRQALVEDPDFATAHIYLALALKNLSQPDWRPEAARAFTLASEVSERERYFIVGTYEILSGHPIGQFRRFKRSCGYIRITTSRMRTWQMRIASLGVLKKR